MSASPDDGSSSIKEDDRGTSNSISNESAKRILKLLKTGDEKINLGSYREAVLVLGNTGSGKTTFTQFIAGDNDHLISTEVGEDSGEFIISDSNDKISVNNTVISKTTFPELVVDTESKTAYVDNPGFNDSRNEAYDIAAAYFIKKVLDTVKNVKIVLIVSHSSLQKGGSRNDFLQLLEHITILLKNIDKYTDSISLVATKVENKIVMRKGVPVIIDDTAVIDNMANFLKEVKESLKIMLAGGETYVSELKRVESTTFYENAIKLLDALLTKKDSKYSRLGIFRRPDAAGPVSQIQLLQKGKKKIRNMVRQNLRYLPIDKTDIGYAVSDKSKNVIRDLVTEINKGIVSNMACINKNLINRFHDLERNMLKADLYALRNRLKSASEALSRITTIGESVSAAEFVTTMCQSFAEAQVRVSKSRLSDITNLGKFLIFLQDISAKKYESSVWKWTKELDETVQYVDNSLKWYAFLVSLYERLSQYDVQKNKASYRVPTLNAITIEDVMVKNSNDFVSFLNDISDANFLKIVNYEEVKKIRLDDIKIRFFDLVIQATLKDAPVYTCYDKGQRMQVVGEYVLLSEVLSNRCYDSSKSVQVFAKHTIFVDVSMRKENDISIIAPRWEIIGQQTIVLDGQPAPLLVPHEANSGLCRGCRGDDGEPGLPGSSAGHFFGIGSHIQNVRNLHISANGGPGSGGQLGGHGAPGEVGETHWTSNPRRLHCEINQDCITEIDYTKSGLFNLNVQANMEHTVYGSAGGNGGDGGCRGAGGIGGNSGKIITIDTSDGKVFASSTRTAKNGDEGLMGDSGWPGEGGEGGNHLRRYYNFGTWTQSGDFEQSVGRARSGRMGRWGNCVSEKNPRSPDIREFLYPPSRAISDYRNELVKNFDDSVKKHASSQFYKELQRNVQLNEYYDVDILLRELQHLQKYQHKFAPDITLILFNSLREKIVQVAETRHDDRQLLEYLLLTVTSKLLRLQARSDNYTAFDLQQRFQKVTQKFEKLFYAGPQFIHETLPSTELLDDILSVLNTLDYLVNDNVDSAIERVDAQILESLHQKQEEQVNEPHDLGILLLRRKFFDDLKTLTQFVHFLSILATADRQNLGKMGIAEIFPYMKFKPIEIAPTIKDHLEEAIFNFQLKATATVDAFKSFFSAQRKSYEMSANPRASILDDLRKIERKMQFGYYKTAKSFSDEKVKGYMKTIEELSAQLKNENLTKYLGSDEIKIVERTVAHRKLIEFDPILYNRMNREEDIDRLVKALEEAKDLANKLESSRSELNTLIFPILNYVNSDLNGPYNPDKISATRMMVTNFLENVKTYLYGTIGNFEIDEDLQSISESLDGVVNILSNINEMLASYEDETRLLAFFERVSDDKKETLGKEFLSFEYERLMNVFKRSVFPFDKLSTDMIDLPSASIPEDTNQSIEIFQTSLESKMNESQTILDNFLQNSGNQYALEDYFNSTNQQGPMFEWRSEVYGNSIAKLLRGQPVALMASADPSDDRQFMRFDSLRLRFQAINDTTQLSLDDALSNFTIGITHSGSSYYTFCNRVRMFNGDPWQQKYTDETTSDEVQPIRSPYTTWIFSLRPINENVTFGALHPFIEIPIDLHLEGHAKYLKLENETEICEKYEISSMSTDYTELKGQPQPVESIRSRRSVSNGIVDTFKSWNPLDYDMGIQTDDFPVSKGFLEYENEPKSSTSSLFQTSFSWNGTLPLVDYIVRNFTKVKPYRSSSVGDEFPKFDQLSAGVLRIVDEFEALCAKVSNEYNLSSDQLSPDPVVLMSELEKPLSRGDRSEIQKILRNSVRIDSKIEPQFDDQIVEMLGGLEFDRNNNDGIGLGDDQASHVYDQSFMDKAINPNLDEVHLLSNNDYNTTLLN